MQACRLPTQYLSTRQTQRPACQLSSKEAHISSRITHITEAHGAPGPYSAAAIRVAAYHESHCCGVRKDLALIVASGLKHTIRLAMLHIRLHCPVFGNTSIASASGSTIQRLLQRSRPVVSRDQGRGQGSALYCRRNWRTAKSWSLLLARRNSMCWPGYLCWEWRKSE